MKKTILVILACIQTLCSVQAQIDWTKYSQSFPGEIRQSPSAVALILAIGKDNNSFWGTQKTSKHFETLDKDPDFKKLRPKEILSRTTFDTARAQFFLHGVNPMNAATYQFRVMQYPGNRIVVPWNRINHFTDSSVVHLSGFAKMAYLGGYKAKPGSMLIVDVKKIKGGKIVATSLVAWEAVKPEITSIYTSKTMDEFLKHLQSPWIPEKQSIGHFKPVFSIPATNGNLIFYLQNGQFNRKQIQYELLRNGRIYRPWRYNDYDNNFVWIKDAPPGSYVIKIRYSAQPQHFTEYRFNIEPIWYQKSWFLFAAGILLAGLLGLVFLLIRQRRITAVQQVNKERLELELKGIYAQLNPHFIFNSLSSIQGLINKGDLKGANIYLSDFARLMRQSLDDSQKNQVALQLEIDTISTYLKLEQLRFGFGYMIRVDPDINPYETSIPRLLLQPLVENAVKHGIASMGENGFIELLVNKSQQAMIVQITDNGKGFEQSTSNSGLGIKLTRDRIALLNQLHSESHISLSLNTAAAPGAQITLTFEYWFS